MQGFTDQKRLFVALILSMGAIYLWNYFYVTPKVEAQQEYQQKIEAQKKAEEAKKPKTLETSTKSGEIQKIDELNQQNLMDPTAIFERKELIGKQFTESQRVKINSNRLHGSINLKGALIDDLTLANYREELDINSPEVVLLSPRNTKKLYFVRTGWTSSYTNIQMPDESTLWQNLSNGDLTPQNPLTLQYINPQGVTFIQKIEMDERFMLKVTQQVINNSESTLDLFPIALVNRTKSQEEIDAMRFISHEGAISVADEILNEADYTDLEDEGKVSFEQVSGWVGFTDQYWLSAIIPDEPGTSKHDITFRYYRKNKINRFQVDILSENYSIPPGGNISHSYNLYLGAKKLSFIDDYQEKLNIPLFDRAIDFGWFYFLTKPIFKALTFFNNYTGNFGIAILILTLVIRVILFPLANKSYSSMAKMRKHMPEIQRLRERYKNDRQQLGMEMMKYYKDHRINPMSGCFPLLVQIPVFFSLYKVLSITIEMRHAPFYAWIEDLSVKDPTNILNLFGLLPYTPPEWLPVIGVLPLMFSLSMFFQQKLNPPPSDETQRIVMSWLPWIFLFVFASFPAGLVLYWVFNNILSIIQQYIITRQVEEDKNA
jgi:YidC/Oxa1 family membrane protein insertase